MRQPQCRANAPHASSKQKRVDPPPENFGSLVPPTAQRTLCAPPCRTEYRESRLGRKLNHLRLRECRRRERFRHTIIRLTLHEAQHCSLTREPLTRRERSRARVVRRFGERALAQIGGRDFALIPEPRNQALRLIFVASDRAVTAGRRHIVATQFAVHPVTQQRLVCARQHADVSVERDRSREAIVAGSPCFSATSCAISSAARSAPRGTARATSRAATARVGATTSQLATGNGHDCEHE